MSTSPPWIKSLVEAVRRGLKTLEVDPPMTAVEWADEYFYMSSESSYGEGKWTTEFFQVALLNAMGNDLIHELNLPKSARIGYTKMLMANIAYKIKHKKRSVCMWSPTDDDAKGIMKKHVDPMIRDVPVIKAMAPWFGKKHKDNTEDQKTFENRKVLWWLGGKAAGNYREKSPDEVGYDELSSFDADINNEGSPTFLGDKRLEGATFPKSIRGSTPKLAGSCQITRAAEESAYLLRFHIQCPHCRTEQTLKWGGKGEAFGLKWSKDALGEVDKAWYLCESGNGCAFEHYQMVEASRTGRYICEKTGVWTRDSMEWFGADDKPIRTPRRLTFHIWTIYSTFTTWVKIADERVKAGKDRGKLKTFVNTTLGEPWEEDLTEKVDWELLRERREVYAAQVPARCAALMGGIDTQDDRYELRVNDAAKALLLAYAQGGDLDQLAANVNVHRLVIQAEDQATFPPSPKVMESHDALRERAQAAFEGLTTAGPRNSYIQHARSASALVGDATAESPAPAVVVVTVQHLNGDGTADQALLKQVEAYLSQDNILPVADRIFVQGAEVINYRIDAILHMEGTGSENESLLIEAKRRLNAWVNPRRRLGVEVARSGIDAQLHINGVRRVELPGWSDIRPTKAQAAYCTDVTVKLGD
ncbi:terminase gpA endonuclease subunit [Pseudomonas sp. FDAARGOS_380]|uniref:terminase gpA endonuclease subunit n=1 Tax=Pseudomonas sp. FDAARGOS_380 TaxID=2018067 RepID=UPI0015A78330|nr:terminase gpA endonuclease subunit [Pseudomonas sp. FDAARGOS_380]